MDENYAKTLSANAWYELDAIRAVNQAIGRIIRHKNDYGAILLCDIRYDQANLVRNMSSWIQTDLDTTSDKFYSIHQDVREFFENIEGKVTIHQELISNM